METKQTIALFGQAEKGHYSVPILCRSLSQLAHAVGEAPTGSLGVFYGVQALLYQHSLLYFRVEEEGYSERDYRIGLEHLSTNPTVVPITALFMPGVSSKELIEAGLQICRLHKGVLLFSEFDLYDYLTAA